MPGMNSGVNVNDPTVVAAFKAVLLHQGLIALLIFALLGLAWVSVRAWQPFARNSTAQAPGTPAPVHGRACLAAGAAGRLWPAVGLRRDLAGPAQNGDRPALAGARARRGGLPAMGAAPGELGRDELVVSPDASRGVSGVDPGRDRHLDARCLTRHLVPARGTGQRRLGACGLGVR